MGAEPAHAEKGLNEAAGFIRNALFKMLQIHTVPTLHFAYDNTEAKAADLSLLITQANASRAVDFEEDSTSDAESK
jgi:ribosome-binding factor A